MLKKYLLIIFCIIIIAGACVYILSKNKKIELASPTENKTNQPIFNSIPNNQPSFFVSGWLPYWGKVQGVASLSDKLSLFSEIHPFAFGVNSDGSLRDTLKIGSSPWTQLEEEAKKENVAIVPTILWGDAQVMHNIFSNQNLLDHHVNKITDLLEQNNFSGVDIDYEGKDVADRDIFSAFLQKLHAKLANANKTLNCTVEARTQDFPPTGWSGTRAMAFANDFFALNQDCDSVTIMAYDEAFQTNGAKQFFESASETPAAPNADNQWVEQVMQYALQFIPADKLILGVPTYGWEFQLSKLIQGYRYTRIQSVSFQQAIVEAKVAGVMPTRDSGGELSFIYKSSSGENIVTFFDAEAVRQKIELAKKYHFKGISLFKLDGLADPELFSILQKR